jgi:hypothetical protein
MFDNIEIIDQDITVNLNTYEILNETEVDVDAVLQGASRIEITGKGHCYLFNSTKLPDTSDYISHGIESSADTFHSIIEYSAGNDSLFVRAYIIFGDSIVYSNRGKINLNN